MPEPESRSVTQPPSADDELLWTERPGWTRRRRTATALALTALLAAAAGYAVYRNEHHPARTSAASHRHKPPSMPLSELGQSAPTNAITTGGGSVYLLASGGLYRDQVDGSGRSLTPAAVSSAVGLDLTEPGVSYRLVLDAAANRLWVVGSGAVDLPILAFNARTLALQGRLRTPGIVQDAAALGGHLYLAEGSRVLDVNPKLIVRPLAGVRNSVFSLAADPTRHRLILFEPAVGLVSFEPRLDAWSLATPPAVPKGWLQVTVGAIWMAGYGTNGPMIARLDPSTLRAVLSRTVPHLATAGAQFAGAGAGVLWIGSADGGPGVVCASLQTGSALEYWPNLARIASLPGRAYVNDGGSTPQPVRLARCRG